MLDDLDAAIAPVPLGRLPPRRRLGGADPELGVVGRRRSGSPRIAQASFSAR